MYLKKLTSPSAPNLNNIRLITLNQLKIDKKKLGEGEFATVYAAKLILGDNSDKKFPVAAKILRHSIEYVRF
uniref:Protein kinase domain-containing protein n=1 Tax=Acrobeloides nanus TaxID=290746 RepID=A0A914CWG8_9BILA